MKASQISVLIACESSGVVRDAFRARGFNAYSCDILPADEPSPWHFQCDVESLLKLRGFDFMIAHPPCTHLAVSGARWFPEKRRLGLQQAAIAFFMMLAQHKAIKRGIVSENPISIMSSEWRKPDQIIQPWMFGHGEVKATCLWLEGDVPPLKPTKIVDGREARVHKMPPGPDRWKERSRTLQGIGEAMAQQWGDWLLGL